MQMLHAIPALPIGDVTRSVAFYRDVLGFTLVHHDDGFVIFQREAVEIHVWQASDTSWQTRDATSPIVSGAESFIAGTASCRFAVTSVDELHHELQPAGIVHPNAQLADQPWGTREFGVLDPDNNLLTFFERR